MKNYYELIFYKKNRTYERQNLNSYIDSTKLKNLLFIELWKITKIDSDRELKSKCLTRIYIGHDSKYLDLFSLMDGYKIKQISNLKYGNINTTDRVLYNINKKARHIEIYKIIRKNDIVLNTVQDFFDFINLIQNKEEIKEEVKKLKLTHLV